MATTIQLQKNSMFVNTPVYNVNNDIIFGLRIPLLSPELGDNIVIIDETTSNRLDSIARKYYGDYQTRLWWAIADASNIHDPMTEVVFGKELTVPKKDRITST